MCIHSVTKHVRACQSVYIPSLEMRIEALFGCIVSCSKYSGSVRFESGLVFPTEVQIRFDFIGAFLTVELYVITVNRVVNGYDKSYNYVILARQFSVFLEFDTILYRIKLNVFTAIFVILPTVKHLTNLFGFYRAMLCIARTMLLQDICLSRTPQLCQNSVKTARHFF